MEPEGSLPLSKEISAGPYLSKMHPVHIFPPYFLNNYSNSIFLFAPKTLSSLWFSHRNIIWWSVKFMKLLIMNSSPNLLQFLSLRSKYFPQHLLLKYLQSNSFLNVREQSSNQHKIKVKTDVYSDFYVPRMEARRKKLWTESSKHSPNLICF